MMDQLAPSVFVEVAALLALAAAVGFVGNLLRQPLIVGFIVVGLVAGPSALDLVRSNDPIDLLSQLGIAVLLFLVGIKLDLDLIRSLGTVALTTGIGQVLFTSIVGFGIGWALGFDPVTNVYVSVALTFSSTIIIVKLLSDKREIDSLHGQIALGFLIVQDLIVVVAMIALSAIGIGLDSAGGIGGIGFAFGSGVALVLVVLLFVRYVADPLVERLMPVPELLVVFAIALGATFAAFGDLAGLGKEIGGLLAGVCLASTPYRDSIAARLGPLRDFLLLFFFIGLGARLEIGLLGDHVLAAAIFSGFVLVGNPLIVMAIMGAMGFRKRTGFLAGLTVAQISEFSLIFVAMGVSLGHVTSGALGLVTLVGLVTIAVSTYMITYSHQLYAWFEPLLTPFERKEAYREPEPEESERAAPYDVVIFGMGRFGTAIALRLRRRGVRVLGIDFSPLAVRRSRGLELDVAYGDATDPEMIAALPWRGAQWVLSTIPVHSVGVSHDDPRRTVLQAVRRSAFRGRTAVTSHSEADTAAMLAAGADVVLEPFQDAADRAVEIIFGAEVAERTPATEPEPE